MTYYEWWYGDSFRGIVDQHERDCLLEEGGRGHFIQLNNLP